MSQSSLPDNKTRKIFVSYAWGNDNHQSEVRSFTDYLRKNGFHAEMDNLLSQEETSINFKKMMYKAMQHEKVIIVLSPQYKNKADNFEGGVGMEFQLMINDIGNNPKKYIILALDGISKEIIPFGLQGYEIVDFRHPDGEEKLFRKILERNKYDFSPVAEIFHEFPTFSINSFNPENRYVKIEDPFVEILDTSGRNSGYSHIDLGVTFTFRNISRLPFDYFSYEAILKEEMLKANTLRSQDGFYHLGDIEDKEIKPGACVKTDMLEISIEARHIKTLFRHPLVIRVGFDFGSGIKFFQREFSVDYLIPRGDSSIPLEILNEINRRGA